MRIVQIEDFFHPNAGYQVNILSKYFSAAGHDVIIVTAELDKMPNELTAFFGKDNIDEYDKEYETKYAVKIIRVPVKKYISGRVWYDDSIFFTVDNLNPDVLYVHGNDTLIAIQYFFRINKLKYPILSDSHMLEMASKNRFSNVFRMFYRKLVAPIITKNNITVIRTQDNSYVEKCLGIPLNNCPIVSFGSDTMLFHPDEEKKRKFREMHDIKKSDFVVIYAGKLDEAKGGLLLAEAFEKRISQRRNVVLVVVGNTVGSYGEKIEDVFKKSENRILRFPSQKYVDLPEFYQAADIAVFARQCSLSFYDVQACGLPVVAENNDINLGRCAHKNGKCFNIGDKNGFVEKIREFVEMPETKINTYAKNSINYILRGYDYGDKSREYMDIVNLVYKNFHEKG